MSASPPGAQYHGLDSGLPSASVLGTLHTLSQVSPLKRSPLLQIFTDSLPCVALLRQAPTRSERAELS